jgi:hypothetical protein
MITHVVLAYCHPALVVHDMMWSVMREARRKDIRVEVVHAPSGPNLGRSRECVTSDLLRRYARQPHDHMARRPNYMWWVDADVSWPADTLDRLIADSKDIVGARYISPCATCPSGLHVQAAITGEDHPAFNGTGLQQVDGLGMGCTLMKWNLVEDLGGDAFMPFANFSEDLAYTHRAIDAGYTVWLDHDARVDHWKMQALT